MAKGICVNCGKHVGGIFGPIGFACPGCGKLYCSGCVQKTGMLIKRPVCPECGREMQS